MHTRHLGLFVKQKGGQTVRQAILKDFIARQSGGDEWNCQRIRGAD